MNKILKKAYYLKDEINKEELVKQYLYLKQLIENDKQLMDLRKKIAFYKSKNDKDNYEKYFSIYNLHPLINNFYLLKDELKDFLYEIKEQIHE